jgi:hypothetical protein
MTIKTLSPHGHKLFSELLIEVRLGICALESLHSELEHNFAQLYDLIGDETFKRAFETLHSVPHPLLHAGQCRGFDPTSSLRYIAV